MTFQLDFKMMPPLPITEAEILSGIPDAENQAYDAGTTYATGDQVWYNGKVWQSLVDSNTGNTPVEGANWTDLGEVDDGALEWASGTTYAQDAKVVYQGYVWSSVAGSNTGNTPSTTADPLRWTRLRRTFRYSPFDDALVDTADLGGSVTYRFQLTGLVTEIAILRTTADTFTIKMTDATEGEVYNETFSIIDDSNVADAWDYAFAPIIYQDTRIVEGLPPYAGAEIEVTFTGSAVSIAQILLGQAQAHGITVIGSGVGIEAYDYIDRGDFNRPVIVQRPYSDTFDPVLKIPSRQVAYFKRQFAERRAQFTLFYSSGSEELGCVAYGIFRNLRPIHDNHVFAECTLEIEGIG